MNYETREEWLNAVVKLLAEKLFAPLELRLPEKLRASCGICGGKFVGLCVKPDCADDGACHMFVDPLLNDPVEVIGTLAHEMVHAHCYAEGHDCKHKGLFLKVFRDIGFECKATAQFVTPNTELHATCSGIAIAVGPYPHAPVRRKQKPKKAHAWVSYISTSNEEYVVRANKNTVADLGPPRDYNGEPMVAKNPEDAQTGDDVPESQNEENI